MRDTAHSAGGRRRHANLRGEDDTIDQYDFYAKPLPEEDKDIIPVIVHYEGEAIAALAPIRIYEQGPLFPL